MMERVNDVFSRWFERRIEHLVLWESMSLSEKDMPSSRDRLIDAFLFYSKEFPDYLFIFCPLCKKIVSKIHYNPYMDRFTFFKLVSGILGRHFKKVHSSEYRLVRKAVWQDGVLVTRNFYRCSICGALVEGLLDLIAHLTSHKYAEQVVER